MTVSQSATLRAGGKNPIAAFLIGDSRAIKEVRLQVAQVAPSDASVIVTGPSGSGKEMVARAIHAASQRADAAHVSVNCGAIPRELIESELFGHEKGSFTGAHAQHRGRFEEADGGTLFLDEIGDMPHDMQVKLLRVLEDRRVQRVGGRGVIPVDARIVSATHRDLDTAIDEKRFREDLFYRLAVFPIDLPSLAERREDVAPLIRHFLAQGHNKGDVRFNTAALDRLANHDWPGNVRELRNLVERAGILFPGEIIGAEQVERMLLRRGRASADERAALWAATADIPAPAPVAAAAPAADTPILT
ncbi:sigma-54 dependent transcriptional regulator, partial [Sphingosinicella sp. YJ22]|uniref:sigma-54 interaction domain-containing protein n=1 Tax=Sphingosinicella sp. YJ22 TaxID=1104780 RepID=UPI00140D9F01